MLGAFRQPQGRMVIIRLANSWRHSAPLPILTLTLAMLLWSSSFIALKHVLEVWSFGQVLFMRMGWPPGCWLLCYRRLGNFHYRQGTGAGWP